MPPKKIVLSASRRTDIPAFYMDWFMSRIEHGAFHVKNPINKKISIVPAGPDNVDAIVFWSKDFGRFLEGDHGLKLERIGYNLFFLFTVNSVSGIIEPNVPSLQKRLRQAEELVNRYGPASVWWRFDPICFFKNGDGDICNNLDNFSPIAEKMSRLGIERCITSFMKIYAKVTRRTKAKPGFSFIDPPLEKKIRVACKMGDLLTPMNMSLYMCCENELLASLPENCNVHPGGCISNQYLASRFGGKLSFANDTGQRRGSGCRCTVSRDIGCYDDHPCAHNCLYCYANPKGA
jgi:hypothetical protein